MLIALLSLAYAGPSSDMVVADVDTDVASEEAAPLVRRDRVRALHRVTPTYPDADMHLRPVDCHVRVRIDETGRANRITPSSCKDEFAAEVADALSYWRWQPVAIGGQPAEVEFVFQASFLPEYSGEREEHASTQVLVTHGRLDEDAAGCHMQALVMPDGAVRGLASSKVACQAQLNELHAPSWRASDADCTASFDVDSKGKVGGLDIEGCTGAAKRAAKKTVKGWGFTPGDYTLDLAFAAQD